MSLHFRIAYLQPTYQLRRRCTAVLKKAHERGDLGLYAGPYLATFSGRDAYFNATRYPGDNRIPEDWTQAEIQGRKDAWTMFELCQRGLVEFKEAYFMSSGPVAGARESRRIVGDYELTEEDVREGRRHEEVVVLGAWRLDKYPADSAGYHEISWLPSYDIPYRTLLPKDFDNLLVAGRCHSETLAVLASSRVTATAMGMGQATGTPAALAVAGNKKPREVDTSRLQEKLRASGGIVQALDADIEVGNPVF